MNKIKWLLIVILFLFFLPVKVLAQQACQQSDPCVNISDANQKAECYSSALIACQNQSQTLSGQIDNFNTQIRLKTLQIANTKNLIDKLSTEIGELGNEISRLEGVLTKRSELLLARIPQSYKRSVSSQFGLLLFSSDFSDFVTRIKYLATVQKEDTLLLFQVKTTQNNYNDIKQAREDKKKQLEQAKIQLEKQNQQLSEQKKEKDALLTATQGNESRYQQLLAQAKAQLAAFQGFVQSQGGLTLINADPNWPSDYFSQRDVRWGGMMIAGFYTSGATAYSIGQAGCLISSVAMVLTHRGNNTTPSIIGSNGSYFFNSNFLWSGLTSLGFNTPQRTLSISNVDNILSQGKWAIIGISSQNNTYIEPFHFVVVTSKNGSDYNLFDPWEGPNTSFNSKYSSDYITEVISY